MSSFSKFQLIEVSTTEEHMFQLNPERILIWIMLRRAWLVYCKRKCKQSYMTFIELKTLIFFQHILTSKHWTTKNYTNFTGKQLCWSLRPQACNFIKKRLQHSCFLWNLRNFSEQLFWRTSANDCFWRYQQHIPS